MTFDISLEDVVFFVFGSMLALFIGMGFGMAVATEIYSDSVRCAEAGFGYRAGHCGACEMRAMRYAGK